MQGKKTKLYYWVSVDIILAEPHHFKSTKLFAGVSIALDIIQANDSILENHTLDYVFEDDHCNENQAIDTVVKLVRNHDVDVIIGPGCSPAGRGGGRLASVWNVPMVAYGGTDKVLSDKDTYSTFIRTVGLTSVVAQVIRLLPKVFQMGKTLRLFDLYCWSYSVCSEWFEKYITNRQCHLRGSILHV